jgi:hypothetical protein
MKITGFQPGCSSNRSAQAGWTLIKTIELRPRSNSTSLTLRWRERHSREPLEGGLLRYLTRRQAYESVRREARKVLQKIREDTCLSRHPRGGNSCELSPYSLGRLHVGGPLLKEAFHGITGEHEDCENSKGCAEWKDRTIDSTHDQREHPLATTVNATSAVNR